MIKSEDDTKLTSITQDAEGALIAVHPGGKHAYIACYRSNKILVLDTATNKITKSINIQNEPFGIAANPDGKSIHITHHKSNYLSILDTATNKIVDKITVKDHPAAITISFDGTKTFSFYSSLIVHRLFRHSLVENRSSMVDGRL